MEKICKKIPKRQSGDIMYPRPIKPPRKRFQERSPFNDDLPKERHKILKKLEKGNILKQQVGGMLFVPPKYQTKVAKQTFSKMGEAMEAPQKGATYLVTGKYETPSEAMHIKNPIGKFAIDTILDPLNIGAAALIPKGVSYLNRLKQLNKTRKAFQEKEAGIQFVKNWFDHPETTKRIEDMYDVSDQDVMDLVKSFGHDNATANTLFQAFKQRLPNASSPELYKRLAPNKDALNIFTTQNLDRGYLSPIKDSPKSLGLSYFPENKYLINRNGPRIESSTVHEAMHNVSSNKSTPAMDKIIKEAFGGEKTWDKLRTIKHEDASYLTDPSEVYARVGQLRHHFGLKPGEEVSDLLASKIFTKGRNDLTPVDVNFFELMVPGLSNRRTITGFKDLFNKLPIQAGVAEGVNQLLKDKNE